MLKLALVAGSPLVRAGLDAGLRETGGIDVVLQTATLAQARAAGFAGAQAALADAAPADDELAEADDHTPPLVLLLGPRQQAAGMLHSAWAEGHSVLPADADITSIAAALHAAAAGLVSSTPLLAARASAPRGWADAESFEPLTPRESQVLAQMSFGLGNREIADALHISPHTAKFHVAQVIAKLAASSRAHAVAKALRAGLVDAAA